MLTRDPRARENQADRPRNRRIWPWAAGSIILPLMVITVTLMGARAVARARLAAEVTPAQPLPPLGIATVIQPSSGVALWTLASGARGRSEIVALGGQALPSCLPPGPCGQQPATRFLAYDAASGAQLLSAPLAMANGYGCVTPDGSLASTLYVICGAQLQAFDLATGASVARYTLPVDRLSPVPALDGANNTLYLVGGGLANESLLSYDLTSGAVIAMQGLTAGAVSNPIADAADGRTLVVEDNGGGEPALVAFAARTLDPLGALALPAGTRAGPYAAAADLLFLFGPNGAVGAISLGQAQFSGAQPNLPADVTQFGPLRGASAIGLDANSETLVALYANSVTAYDAESLKPYASAPISGSWDAQRLLPVDGARGITYAPDASGAIVGLRLAPPTSRVARDPATAVALARAGLAPLLPNTNQTPPFMTYQTYPLAQTTVVRSFAIYYGDVGWRGPYTGSASAKVIAAGARPGDYTVAFTLTWNQLFLHTHVWTVELLPDGQVKMISDTGDSIP